MFLKAFAALLIVFVAALHGGFLVLEMFFWDHPVGREVFSMTPEQSAFSATLAANQGLYNGFLAAGLVWAVASRKRDVAVLFLLFVVAAGVFGGITAKPTIFITQAAPGALALLITMISGPWGERRGAPTAV